MYLKDFRSENEKLLTTIQQLRVLAKNYKAKFLALNAEKETHKKDVSDAKGPTEPSAEKSESTTETESAKLKQQLLTARHEIEKYKQV